MCSESPANFLALSSARHLCLLCHPSSGSCCHQLCPSLFCYCTRLWNLQRLLTFDPSNSQIGICQNHLERWGTAPGPCSSGGVNGLHCSCMDLNRTGLGQHHTRMHCTKTVQLWWPRLHGAKSNNNEVARSDKNQRLQMFLKRQCMAGSSFP